MLCLLLGTDAVAQDKKSIALINIEVSGDGPPELRQQLQTHISKALIAEGLKVTTLDQTLKALKSVPELIGCSSTTCLERIFELIPAHRFVRAVVTASGANYEVQLQLLSALEDESIVNTVTESCAVCTISDLHVMAGDAARKLLRPNSEQEVSVEIASDPPGATILIDAIEIGEAPLDAKLKVGSHSVSATLEGHSNSEKIIDVIANSSDQQRFELQLTETAAIQTAEGPVKYGATKWIVAGGSVALLTLGTVLIAIDGDPSCSSTTATCPAFRDTLTGGIVSISGGLVAGALGGWMFWRERSTANPKGSVTIHTTKGGGIAGYGFRF